MLGFLPEDSLGWEGSDRGRATEEAGLAYFMSTTALETLCPFTLAKQCSNNSEMKSLRPAPPANTSWLVLS